MSQLFGKLSLPTHVVGLLPEVKPVEQALLSARQATGVEELMRLIAPVKHSSLASYVLAWCIYDREGIMALKSVKALAKKILLMPAGPNALAWIAGIPHEVIYQAQLLEALKDQPVQVELLAQACIRGFGSRNPNARKMAVALIVAGGKDLRPALEQAIAQLKPEKRVLYDAILKNNPEPATPLEPVIEQLRASWEKTRDVETARLLEQLSRALPRPIPATSNARELDLWWEGIALRKNQQDLPVLLDAPWPLGWKAAQARIKLLGEFPPDPRIASYLVNFLRVPLYPEGGGRFVERDAMRALLKHVDPRYLEELKSWSSSFLKRWFYERPEEIPSELFTGELHKRALDEACINQEKSTRSIAIPEPWDQQEQALLEEVYRNPGLDEPRMVLADFLLEQGNPRGEFIQLQFQEETKNKVRGRAARLEKLWTAHRSRWLKETPLVQPETAVFRRGFLSEAMLHTIPGALARAAGVSAYRTLERVIFAPTHSSDGIAHFLPSLPFLKGLFGILSDAPLSLPDSLEELEVRQGTKLSLLRPPKLKRLFLGESSQLRSYLKHFAPEEIVFSSWPYNLKQLPILEEQSSIQKVTWGGAFSNSFPDESKSQSVFRMIRGPDGSFSRLEQFSSTFYSAVVEATFQVIPDDFKGIIVVQVHASDRPKLEKLLQRFKKASIEIQELP
jgi:uncharacterized protein (TIGR02996 family)